MGFGKSLLVPLQPSDIFILAVVVPKWRPVVLKGFMAISRGTVPLLAPVGTKAGGQSVLPGGCISLILLGTDLGFPGLALVPVCLGTY